MRSGSSTTEVYRRFVEKGALNDLIAMALGRKPLSSMRWEEIWDSACDRPLGQRFKGAISADGHAGRRHVKPLVWFLFQSTGAKDREYRRIHLLSNSDHVQSAFGAERFDVQVREKVRIDGARIISKDPARLSKTASSRVETK